MKLRKYAILSKLQSATNIDHNSDTVLLDNLNIIPDCSADIISCDSLDYRNYDQINSDIKTLLSKLKPNGKLIISIVNYKKICSEFLLNKIKSSTLFEYLQNKQSTPTIDDILTNVDADSTKLLNIDHKDYHTSIIIERITV